MLSEAEVAEAVLFVIELAVSFIGNSFFLFVLKFTKNLRRSASTNLIFNSASIDFLNALVNIPFALDYLIVRTGNLDNSVAPMVVTSMITFFLLLTLHSTLALMADKLLILRYPVFYRNTCTVKKARAVCLSVWLSSSIYTLSMAILKEQQSSEKYSTLIEYMTARHRGKGKFFTFGMTTSVLVLLATVSFITDRELKVASRKQFELQKLDKEGSSNGGAVKKLRQSAQIKKNCYACRTILIILVVHIISFLPIAFNSLLRILDVTPLEYNREHHFIPLFCSQLGASINPLIFILRSKTYRKAAGDILKESFTCFARNNRVDVRNRPPNFIRLNHVFRSGVD